MEKKFLDVPYDLSRKRINLNSKAVLEHTDSKKYDESPQTCTTAYSITHPSSSIFSPKQQVKGQICKNKLKVLDLHNENIKIRLENESLKFVLVQKDSKIKKLKGKIKDLYEESRKKEVSILKITETLTAREYQFAKLFEAEQEKFLNLVGIKNHEIAMLKKSLKPISTLNKANQTKLDLAFDEGINEKNQEIIHLQEALNGIEKVYLTEKSYLVENISILEEELEKAKNLVQVETDKIIPYLEEITKICNEVSMLKHEFSVYTNSASDLLFPFQPIQIPLETLQHSLSQAFENLSELRSLLKSLI